MNKYDITTSWYRSWRQRHPVIDEWIGFGLVCLFIWFVAYLVLA
jgi:hypothetical protein